jgi:hypothetical protein
MLLLLLPAHTRQQCLASQSLLGGWQPQRNIAMRQSRRLKMAGIVAGAVACGLFCLAADSQPSVWAASKKWCSALHCWQVCHVPYV